MHEINLTDPTKKKYIFNKVIEFICCYLFRDINTYDELHFHYLALEMLSQNENNNNEKSSLTTRRNQKEIFFQKLY